MRNFKIGNIKICDRVGCTAVLPHYTRYTDVCKSCMSEFWDGDNDECDFEVWCRILKYD